MEVRISCHNYPWGYMRHVQAIKQSSEHDDGRGDGSDGAQNDDTSDPGGAYPSPEAAPSAFGGRLCAALVQFVHDELGY